MHSVIHPRRQQAGYQEVRFLRNETEIATPLIAGQLARWDRYPKRQQAGHPQVRVIGNETEIATPLIAGQLA